MADTLCGPSNALSSFQKHSQVDRTLQQDRIVGSRHLPSQGFRSADPRAGSLDADFHAFENAPTNPFQLEQSPWQQNATPLFAARPPSHWASDFQNLHISTSSTPVHQFRSEAPVTQTAPGAWQQEFATQWPGSVSLGKQKQHETNASFAGANYMGNVGLDSYVPQQALPYTQAAQMQNAQPQFNELAFEQAFQDAFDQMSSDVQSDTIPMDQPQTSSETVEETMIHEPSTSKIGADAINYTETQDRTVDQDTRDANDLARVAGELIYNVSHETNEKFKNSQFLDLMRKIRDKEMEVRNNDFASAIPSDIHQPAVVLPAEQQTSFQFPDMDQVFKPDTSIDMSIDDEFQYNPPRNQISDLHPGGPYYPEQSPPKLRYAQMSGAIDTTATADYATA